MNNFVCFQKFAKNPPNQNNLKESHYYALMQGEIHAKNMWKDEINRSQKVGNEPGCQSDEDQLKWGKGVLQKQVLVALCKDFASVIIALVLPPTSSDHLDYCDHTWSRLLRGPTLKTWNIRPANCRGKVRKAARCAAKCCQDFFKNPWGWT